MVMAHEWQAWVSDAGKMECIAVKYSSNELRMVMFLVWIFGFTGLVETFVTFCITSIQTCSPPCSSSP